MTPITRQDILAHQAVVPWAAQHQVEQDLLLYRAMLALFDDTFSIYDPQSAGSYVKTNLLSLFPE